MTLSSSDREQAAPGNTPLLKLNNLIPASLPNFLVKLEYFNPGGSVKDRPAQNMIAAAEEEGKLPAGGGGMIIEATSGNTGIGLARTAARRGHDCLLVVPESASMEKRRLMQAFGTTLELTPAGDGMQGAHHRCRELSDKYPESFRPDQFSNPNNPGAHYRTTGPEIKRATGGNIKALIAAAGTGGTITGTGRYLKEKLNSVDIYSFESENSPVLNGGEPGCHNIPGTGPGFVPEIISRDIIDEIFLVDENEVYDIQQQLARQEGLLLGPSSAGGILTGLIAAEKYPDTYSSRDNFVLIAADSGERYLSEL